MATDVQDTVVMAWEGGRLDGWEIACTVTSMAATIAAQRFHRRTLLGKPIRGKDLERVAAVFAGHVVRWNLRSESGRPVPVNAAAFLMLHRDAVMAVLRRWVEYVHALPTEQAPAPEVEAPAVPVEDGDLGALLEARSLQQPGPDEQLVEQVPELVGASA